MPVKGFHGGLSFLCNAIPLKHLQGGQVNDLDIDPQREVIHIPHIEFELLRPADGIPAMTLRPSGYTRTYCMSAHLFLGIQRQVFRE